MYERINLLIMLCIFAPLVFFFILVITMISFPSEYQTCEELLTTIQSKSLSSHHMWIAQECWK